MKICSQCGINKDRSMFHRKAQSKDGRSAMCKECVSARMRDYYLRTAEEKKQKQREYRAQNIEKVREIDRLRDKTEHRKVWRAKNYRKNIKKFLRKGKEYYYTKRDRNKARAAARRHYRRHKDRYAVWKCERRQRVPIWFGELDQFVSDQACELRELRNKLTGIKWHVDHIIPIKGDTVCGLHVWNNLRVIPAVDNLRKGNTFDAGAA